MVDEVGFIGIEKGVLKKIGFVVLIASLLFFVLGLAFFLQGPDERIVMLNATEDYEILLAPQGNRTIGLSPFQSTELCFYRALNRSEFLINRTIDIWLNIEESGEVNLYIMNSTQFKLWKNGSAPSEEITEKLTRTTRLTFSPKNVWGAYFLVLVNMRNGNISVDIEVSQQFLIKGLDYGRAFMWLKVAALSAIPLFLLQIPLKVTLDDIINRIVGKMLPARYRKYVIEKRSFILTPFFLGIIIVGATAVLASIYFSHQMIDFLKKLGGKSSLIDQIIEDCCYRFAVEMFLLYVALVTLFYFVFALWNLLLLPLKHKYYPDFEIYKKHTETFLSFLQKFLIKPRILLYLCSSLSIMSVLALLTALLINIDISFTLVAWVLSPLLALYFGYALSWADLKTQQIAPTDPIADFKFNKALSSSVAIFSVVAVYALQAFVLFVNLTSKYIVDQAVLNLFSSRRIVEVFNNLASLLPNSLFLAALVLYWSQTIFSVVYWPRKKEFKDIRLPKDILTDLILDLLFFLVVFVFSLLIISGSSSQPQSLVRTVNPQEILSSLISALIASSFEDYLEAIRPSVR